MVGAVLSIHVERAGKGGSRSMGPGMCPADPRRTPWHRCWRACPWPLPPVVWSGPG